MIINVVKMILVQRILRPLRIAGYFFVVASIGGFVLPAAAEQAMDQAPATRVFDEDDINWSRIDPQQVADVLQMLADQARGNHERIRTWQGKYRVSMQEPLSKEYVESWPRGSLGGESASALTRHSRFTIRFAVDYASDSIFRSKETVSTRLFRQDSKQEVTVRGGTPVDNNSAVTPAHYIYVSPKTVRPNLGVLPEHPEAQNNRAAFRESIEAAKKQGFGDLMDPRDFFGFTRRDYTYGDQLLLYASNRRGDHGEEEKNRVWDLLELYQTERDGKILYRLVSKMVGPQPTYAVSVWNSAVGFNPLGMILAKQKNGEEPIQEVRTEWKSVEDIFVPKDVTHIAYGEGGKVRYKRTATLEDCVLNQPLDPHQFDYQGLGLKDGELIIDKIENTVYVMKQGEPVKLANFGDAYVPPISERLGERMPSIRSLMIIATLAVIAVLLILIRRRRVAET